jgi:hypothetical protein
VVLAAADRLVFPLRGRVLVAQETRRQHLRRKETTADMVRILVVQAHHLAAVAVRLLLAALLLTSTHRALAVTAQHQHCRVRQQLMQAAAVVAHTAQADNRAHRAAQAVAVTAAQTLWVLLELPIPAVAVAAADLPPPAPITQAAQAALASSSFPTLCRPALRSSLSPQQRGLPPRARPRWITLALVAAAAVLTAAQGIVLAAVAVAVALVVLELAPV